MFYQFDTMFVSILSTTSRPIYIPFLSLKTAKMRPNVVPLTYDLIALASEVKGVS